MRQFKNRMFAFESRRRIVLIHNNLLSIFVIAVANGLPISRSIKRNYSPNEGERGSPTFTPRRHSPLPEAVGGLTVIFQFFRKRQACSWETQQRNEGATVSIVSRSSFLFFWRDGSPRF